MMKTGLGENEDEEKEVRNLGDCSLSSSFRVHRKGEKDSETRRERAHGKEEEDEDRQRGDGGASDTTPNSWEWGGSEL